MIKTIRTIQNIFLKNGKEQDQSQETNGIIKEIPLDDIVEEDQVRKTMNEETVKELAVSIAQEGLLQPIGVHPIDNKKYKIIYGHRRYKAICLINNEASIKNLARENGHIQLNTVTALIRIRQPEKRNTITQMIENLQREKLNPHEEARALEEIGEKEAFSDEKQAKLYIIDKQDKLG